MTPGGGGAPVGTRPPTLIATQQPPPGPQPMPAPPIVKPPSQLDPRVDPRLLQNMQPKSEQKQIANVPVSLPPPQDPNLVKSQVLVPEKTDWTKIYQTATDQSKPPEPLLSQQLNQLPPHSQPPQQEMPKIEDPAAQYIQPAPPVVSVPVPQPKPPPQTGGIKRATQMARPQNGKVGVAM